ncbi:hypothetical protein [Burkholderia glumae]|uniref:hypothetical protein n=1 Tax=Burkholderia glumae TaxID=337 RepID=UPI001AE1CB04|nr:hypothetical protein [Burkholderia glumae]
MSRARGRAGRRAGRGRPPLPGGTAGCLLALALSCSPARAMPAAGAPAVAAQDAPRIVPGAVVAAQVETLRAVASRYNLRIAVISARGDYLSGIDFEIASGPWPLFRARTAGAFLAAHLSPGPYTIRAPRRYRAGSRSPGAGSRRRRSAHRLAGLRLARRGAPLGQGRLGWRWARACDGRREARFQAIDDGLPPPRTAASRAAGARTGRRSPAP